MSETIDSYMDGFVTDFHPSFNHRDFEPDCSLDLFSQTQTQCADPSDLNLPRDRPPAEAVAPDLQGSPVPLPAVGLAEDTQNKTNVNSGDVEMTRLLLLSV